LEAVMNQGFFKERQQRLANLAVLVLALGFIAGCKYLVPAARSDQQIASDIQTKLKSESALAGQDIRVSVNSGVATLDGTVTDAASRSLAGNDSGTVAGVKTVVNNLIVQAPQQAIANVAVPPPPLTRKPQSSPPKSASAQHRPAYSKPSATAAGHPAPQYQPAQAAQTAPVLPTPPAAPPAPPQAVVRNITLPAGTILPVRISETMSSKDAQANDVFHGSLAGDIGSQGVIVIHQGAPVLGRVVDAKDAAHFKGSALLSLELTEITVNGKKVTLVTDAYSKQGEGRGKDTALKAGGGAVLGAIIGGIAGGGKGAAIGTLAGGAAGTGVNAATRGQQVVIPTETLINFQLQSPIVVTVTIPPAGNSGEDATQEPQLQTR
jgi:hypothetical protein